MIATAADELVLDDVFFRTDAVVPGLRLYLKLEQFNPAGSIKLKTASRLVSRMEEEGRITPGRSELIESSSGNLGVALSMICVRKGYGFTCVVDPNITAANARLIELLGGKLVVVTETDENNGYLSTRIRRVKQMLLEDPRRVWIDQYGSPGNAEAHFRWTAPSIFNELGPVDFLFVGCGTGGTLMGCAQYIAAHQLPTKLIAVDPVGSVSFGQPAAKRFIPGAGTSQVPAILDSSRVDDVVFVEEAATAAMCVSLARNHGLCLGGSSGMVVAGVKAYAPKMPRGATCAAIMPDGGGGYIDTLYNTAWLRERKLDLQGQEKSG